MANCYVLLSDLLALASFHTMQQTLLYKTATYLMRPVP